MRVTDEVMERLRAVNTPTLANALDDLGFSGVMNGIQAVGAGLRCVGRCKKVSATVWEGQAEIVRAMPAVPEHGAEDDDELAHRRDQPSKSISRTRPVPVSTISSPRKPAWASRPEIVDIRIDGHHRRALDLQPLGEQAQEAEPWPRSTISSSPAKAPTALDPGGR
jgi:hypothetical protein